MFEKGCSPAGICYHSLVMGACYYTTSDLGVVIVAAQWCGGSSCPYPDQAWPPVVCLGNV